jgi:hypothetical protein
MKNRKKRIPVVVLAFVWALLLASCMEDATEVDQKVDIQNGKALIGVWEASTVKDILFTSNVQSWNLVFTDSVCYFINEYRGNSDGENGWDSLGSGDSGWGLVVKSEWSASATEITFQSNPYPIINLSEKWPLLRSSRQGDVVIKGEVEANSQRLLDGISYTAYTFSNIDTLAWVLSTDYLREGDSASNVAYRYVPKSPFEFVVLSVQDVYEADDNLHKSMHLTDKACYERNKGGDIDKLCEVKVFVKRGRPYFAEAIKNIDTISTTQAYYPNGIFDGASDTLIVERDVARGNEWW